jgi:hypothetical protein
MQETKTKVKASDKSNCGAARRRGKEAGVKAASSRTETGYEADGADEWASAVAEGFGGTSYTTKSGFQRRR